MSDFIFPPFIILAVAIKFANLRSVNCFTRLDSFEDVDFEVVKYVLRTDWGIGIRNISKYWIHIDLGSRKTITSFFIDCADLFCILKPCICVFVP